MAILSRAVLTNPGASPGAPGSYGLTQILWSTAINPMGWNGGDGDDPRKLFRPETALTVGCAYLKLLYDTHAENDTLSWNARWREALGEYNGGEDSPNYNYADDILSRVDSFQPLE